MKTIVLQGIVDPANLELVTELTTFAGHSMFDDLREEIETNPNVFRKEVAYDLIIAASQEAYALAYRWPYWMSVAFGAICVFLALFMKDITKFMTMQVTAASKSTRQGHPGV